MMVNVHGSVNNNSSEDFGIEGFDANTEGLTYPQSSIP